MWSVETATVVALMMLLGTLAGSFLLFSWSGFLKRAGPVRSGSEPGLLVRVAWPTVEMITQFWSLGVVVAPDLFYATFLGGFAIPSSVQWFGVLVWASGGGLALWSTREMRSAMRPQILVAEGQRLVRSGPYSSVRHPMYTALVVIALGMGLAFLSIPVAVLTVALLAMARERAELEERLLSSPEGFGKEYVVYMSSTGRFLPIIRR